MDHFFYECNFQMLCSLMILYNNGSLIKANECNK